MDTISGAAAPGGEQASREPAPDVVAERFTGQFGRTFLTLESIVQGVALTALVARVEATYTGFGVSDWLLTATTFLAILAVWHEYLLQVLAYIWLPTFFDSLLPFGFVILELFLGHLVYHNERRWLLVYGLFYLLGLAAWYLQHKQLQQTDEQSRRIDQLLAPHDRLRGAMLLAFGLLNVSAWALYDVLQLGRVAPVIAGGVFVMGGAFVARSAPAWRRLVAVGRKDHVQPASAGR